MICMRCNFQSLSPELPLESEDKKVTSVQERRKKFYLLWKVIVVDSVVVVDVASQKK